MHIHSLKRAALAACALALFAAAPAAAASVPAELRVEAIGQDLSFGWTYFSDTTTLNSSTSSPCNGSGDSHTMEGPTALGILEHARLHNPRLDPVRIHDRFEFGLFVCGIGAFTATGNQYWTYKVNHVLPEVGADKYALQPGDDVLWVMSDPDTGVNTGNELELVAPRTVAPGEPFEVTVNEYDFTGKKAPAAGAEIYGGATAVTDANGKATITFDGDDPSEVLRAHRGSDVPSQGTRICVGRCQRIAQKRLFGTTRADVISARGAYAEYVSAAGGNDRVDVSGDSFTDRVRCGSGRRDRVRADRRDRVARDCERVTRT